MTEYERQQIAELKDLPGFRLLLGVFEDYEKDWCSGIAAARTMNELNVAARMYQMVHLVRRFLQTIPEDADHQIKAALAQQASLDGLGDAWADRFGREPIQ